MVSGEAFLKVKIGSQTAGVTLLRVQLVMSELRITVTLQITHVAFPGGLSFKYHPTVFNLISTPQLPR